MSRPASAATAGSPSRTQVAQPVGRLHERRPRAGDGVGQPGAVGGVAEPDLLGRQRRQRRHRAVGRQGRARRRGRRPPPRPGVDAELGVEDRRPDARTGRARRRGRRARRGPRIRATWARLVGGVDGQQLRPSSGGPQQLAVEVADVLAARLGPRLVPVVGQQLAAVTGPARRRPRRRRRGRRRPRPRSRRRRRATARPGATARVARVATMASAPSARRAKWTALCRRGAASATATSGHRAVDHLLAVAAADPAPGRAA